MNCKDIVLIAAGLAFASPAMASTPEAWANLDIRVTRACIAMSGLSRPQVLAQKIRTSDDIGVEVRLVRGYDARKRYHRKICVFRRQNNRAEVHDAGGWFGTVTRP